MKKSFKISDSIKSTSLLIFLLFCLVPFLTCDASNLALRADGFDFPVGRPNSEGFYDAQGFGVWNQKFRGYHLGEDWNKKCGGDCDLGEPVFSIANGEVLKVTYETVWGNIVIIRHITRDGKQLDSFYAHMETVDVQNGQSIRRGEKIGSIGKGDHDQFSAHLHFELRNDITIERNRGYSKTADQTGYLNPTIFINAHRPSNSTSATIEPGEINSSKISWDKVESEDFEKYEIYRSEEMDGTQDPNKRKLIFSTDDREVTSYEDKGLRPGTYYYAVSVIYKNGLPGLSDEINYTQANNPIPIETNASLQSNPIIKDDKVYWGDYRYYEPGKYLINYFDLSDMTPKSYPITGMGVNAPTEVDANSEFVVFVSSSPATNTDVYALNIKTGAVNKLNSDNMPYMQNSPSLSENNLAVWSDMRNGSNFDIYYFGLDGVEVGDLRLVAVSGNQRVPKIWGTKVVWNDTRVSNRTDIYYEDILEGSEILVAENTLQVSPDIWKNYITWATRNKLYLYNIETATTEIIPTTGTITWPRINEGKITAFNDGGIFVYDIETQQSEKLTFEGFTPTKPYYSNGYIVFEHRPNLNSPNLDIYLIYY